MTTKTCKLCPTPNPPTTTVNVRKCVLLTLATYTTHIQAQRESQEKQQRDSDTAKRMHIQTQEGISNQACIQTQVMSEKTQLGL